MSKKNELLYILNEKNKLITEEFINNLLMKYDISYKVKNINNFHIAMTHISYLIRDDNNKGNKTKQYQQQIGDVDPIDDVSKALPLRQTSYERLEFVGDSVIHLCLAEYLYNRYDKEDEGFMTRLRTKIENGEVLSSFAKILGINEYIIMSRYIESIEAREKNHHIIEDSFEAFIGALFSEAGFDICKKLLVKIIEEEIDFSELLSIETNFKDKLLQYFHIRKWGDPIYGGLDISGPENKKMFTMYVKCKRNPADEGEIVGTGVGPSKRKGEQEAAKQALINFEQYKEEIDDSDSSMCENYESDEEQ
jgi:dsRNA-specific ribonuclease